MSLETFDVISYLEDRGISYSESGKNVTEGWLNITCPFPGCDDPSNHLGISLESKFFSCWICDAKGPVDKLIQELEDCSWIESQAILGQFIENPYKTLSKKRSTLKRDLRGRVTENKPDILSQFQTTFPKIHLKYFKSRNFDPDILIPKYKLQSSYTLGKYKFRIIAPIIINDEVVSFVGIDVTRKAKVPYKNASDEESIISTKDCLYNIDNVYDSVILVEGITDVWRIGKGSVATLGKKVTTAQVNILVQKEIKNVFVLPDSDAIDEWEKLSKQIAPLFDHVELLELDSGDPADLTGEDLKYIQGLIPQ